MLACFRFDLCLPAGFDKPGLGIVETDSLRLGELDRRGQRTTGEQVFGVLTRPRPGVGSDRDPSLGVQVRPRFVDPDLEAGPQGYDHLVGDLDSGHPAHRVSVGGEDARCGECVDDLVDRFSVLEPGQFGVGNSPPGLLAVVTELNHPQEDVTADCLRLSR